MRKQKELPQGLIFNLAIGLSVIIGLYQLIDLPIPKDEASAFAAAIHIIPAEFLVFYAIKSFSKGSLKRKRLKREIDRQKRKAIAIAFSAAILFLFSQYSDVAVQAVSSVADAQTTFDVNSSLGVNSNQVANLGGTNVSSQDSFFDNIADAIQESKTYSGEVRALSSTEQQVFVPPYEQYSIFMEVGVVDPIHGQGYPDPQLAIDIGCGRGCEIHSPINGTVVARYTDEYGNTILIIDNGYFRVNLWHGDFSVSAGDQVKAGQPVGYESNIGYTKDLYGVLCNGRTYCGNHTHFAVEVFYPGSSGYVDVDPRTFLP